MESWRIGELENWRIGINKYNHFSIFKHSISPFFQQKYHHIDVLVKS